MNFIHFFLTAFALAQVASTRPKSATAFKRGGIYRVMSKRFLRLLRRRSYSSPYELFY